MASACIGVYYGRLSGENFVWEVGSGCVYGTIVADIIRDVSMHGFVPLDPQTNVSQEHFAVVYSNRPARKRFSAGCVEIMESAEQAVATANTEKKRHAARVIGPSKSSEGQYIYYLMEWLST